MPVVPSGEQWELRRGEQRATVVEVGGGVREYRVGDRAVLDPYPVEAMCDGAHGAPLVPWPNRLADGRYRFGGEEHTLALTEPDKHNAIHGLLRWRPWRLQAREESRVVVGTRLFPVPGYPFTLDVEIDYALEETGLRVATTATNRGARACPYACGQHPYLAPGDGQVDDCVFELDASTRIVTDDERQLPVGTEAVAGTAFDYRAGARIGHQRVDFAFVGLARDAQGLAWARLAGPDGRTAELWVDEAYPIIEVYTGDTLAPSRQRVGLGCEPMTCPPNGLQTGEGVVVLEPGESHTATWGAALA